MDRIPIGDHPDEPDNVVRLPGAGEVEDRADDDMSYEDALAADAEAGSTRTAHRRRRRDRRSQPCSSRA